MDAAWLRSEDGLRFLMGEQLPESAHPVSQGYAGHQFGQFNPRLGDGRAVLLGEIETAEGLRDIHLKGSGRTPFSRGSADGRATVGPMLREYLVSEAMHAMGIPSTRTLAVILTGESLRRQGIEPGAILVRVASSHLRVGSFQLARMLHERNPGQLEDLANFAIARHYADELDDGDYVGLLRQVSIRQAQLIAEWMHVGFVHGVMNTDNTAISGETIDYGPCAFVDAFDSNAWFSSIDQQGRYAFGRQGPIMMWNLERLAESLLPLIEMQLGVDTEGAIAAATEELKRFPGYFHQAMESTWLPALGLAEATDARRQLLEEFLDWLNAAHPDHLTMLRNLAEADPQEEPQGTLPPEEWMQRWRAENPDAELMKRINPVRIPRNYLVEEALSQAAGENMEPFEELLSAVTDPFASADSSSREHAEKFTRPAPEGFGDYTTYCGT